VIDRCACKRGFFTLRDCANAATTSCSQCTRRICEEHLAQSGACVECAARQDEEAAMGPTGSAVRSRTRWYRTGGYSPIFWATPDPYWQSTDYRWYGDDSDDDDDGGGFGDS
jgi:hypothetical protein